MHGKGQEATDGVGHRSTRMYIQEGPVRLLEVMSVTHMSTHSHKHLSDVMFISIARQPSRD